MNLRYSPLPMTRLAVTAGLALATLAPANAFAQGEAAAGRAASASPQRASLTTSVDPALFAGLRYRNVGPARGGRVTTVTGVPQEPHTFYMGSTGGGVWKTLDAGETWRNVSDGFFAAGSMGDMDVSDSDPNIVYAGTGSDGLRSNVSIGVGVYKSTDAGKTWTHVGLDNIGQVGALRIHPTNPDIVFVAAVGNPFKPNPERGIFRTTDGGKSWSKVLFVSDSTGGSDVEFMPGNPGVLFATMWRAERKPWTIISGAREGGIYKSTDGGSTWTKLAGGLPNELFGKSNVGVTAANPQRVYALIEAKPGGGLWRSDDAGATWTQTSDMPGLITRPFYYTTLTADPTNADVVYAAAEGFYKSTDGGRTFRSMRTPHGDNHDLWINPDDADIMIQSNDGGANVTLNGGQSWSTQYNQPTAEIYQVYVDNQFPYRLYGAQQDNSTLILPSLPPTSGRPDNPMQLWQSGPGCETGPLMPHPTNPDTIYGSCKGQFSRSNLRTGQEQNYWVGAQSLYGNPGGDLIFRFQRVSPMEVSPHDPSVIYYGSQYVHRTRDEGVTWETISPDLTWNPPDKQAPSGQPITLDVTGEEYYSTLYAIRESTIEPGVIWTGANDGPFHVSRDNGATWTKITPANQPPGCRVQNIEPSPHRRGSAYYAVLCYLLGDFRPYLWRTDDYGRSWTLLTDGTNGIPADHPTRVVREDPDREGLLYAGTEFGMFISFDNGVQWQPFQLNLPHTPITDLKVHRGDLVMSTQGRSFWILYDLSPLHQITDQVAASSATLFTPVPAIRQRYSGGFGGVNPGGGDPSQPQYPPAGAVIDYWLGTAATSQPVTIDILDAGGEVIRRYTSTAPGERLQEPAEPGMRAPRLELVGTPRLTTDAGVNRFTWDLSLPGAWSAGGGGGRGRGGPMVAPGRYSVRLTAGSVTTTKPLEVRMDPRLAADGITDVVAREQLAFNLQARDLVSEVNRLVDRVNDAVDAARAAGSSDRLRSLEALRARLVTPPVRYSKPELQAHIQYLYGMQLGADQRVSGDARARYEVLRTELTQRQAEFTRITGPASN